jgi:hypothetical protein
VRVATRSDVRPPFLGWIASAPMGLKDVPALDAFYSVLAARWRGSVSAARLTAVPKPQERHRRTSAVAETLSLTRESARKGVCTRLAP